MRKRAPQALLLLSAAALIFAISCGGASENDSAQDGATSCGTRPGEVGDITNGYTMIRQPQILDGYKFTLFQLPANPVIGSVQFGILLLNEDGTQALPKPILDVYVTPPDAERDEDDIKTRAISLNRCPQFYEGMIEFEEPGEWEVEIRMSEPVQTSVFYTTDVAQRNRSGGTLVQGTIFFFTIQMLFLAVLAVVFVRARRRRARAVAERAAEEERMAAEEQEQRGQSDAAD